MTHWVLKACIFMIGLQKLITKTRIGIITSFTEDCPVQRVANYGSCVSRGNTVPRKEELLQLKNCFSFSV